MSLRPNQRQPAGHPAMNRNGGTGRLPDRRIGAGGVPVNRAVAPGRSGFTSGAVVEEPWAVTEWTEYYIPTVGGGGAKRPVIYVAAPLCPGMGGMGGMGAMGGMGGYSSMGAMNPMGGLGGLGRGGGFPMRR